LYVLYSAFFRAFSFALWRNLEMYTNLLYMAVLP
jgi:hypothetical protein